MSKPDEDSNPSNASVEKSIKQERTFHDRRKNSIVPPFLENDGLPPDEEVSRDMESAPEPLTDEDFNQLSSDKEENTTEGEITDTHTSD